MKAKLFQSGGLLVWRSPSNDGTLVLANRHDAAAVVMRPPELRDLTDFFERNRTTPLHAPHDYVPDFSKWWHGFRYVTATVEQLCGNCGLKQSRRPAERATCATCGASVREIEAILDLATVFVESRKLSQKGFHLFRDKNRRAIPVRVYEPDLDDLLPILHAMVDPVEIKMPQESTPPEPNVLEESAASKGTHETSEHVGTRKQYRSSSAEARSPRERDRSRRVRAVRVGIAIPVVAVAIAFGVLIWPTAYRYDRVSMTSGGTRSVRIHRITGNTDVLFPTGWRALGGTTVKRMEPRSIPFSELDRIDGKAWAANGMFTCDLYNGSEWTIADLIVHIRVVDRDSSAVVIERDYQLTEYASQHPLTARTYSCYVGFNIQPNQRIQWAIKSARGTPE